MSVATIGMHCILELHGCPADRLDDEAFVRQALEEASQQGLATLLKLTSHHFEPQGVTALGLLAESHISIHTWPESGYAAIDVFTCGDANPQMACGFLVEAFAAAEHSLQEIVRGRPELNTPATDSGSCTQEAALCQARN